MSGIVKPDFYIVGAPKSGTTALYKYLKDHPNVFMPEQKELHFFGSDFTFSTPRMSPDYYQSNFHEAKDEQCVGDASVWYLYSKEAARQIKAYHDETKIIIMLRNPTDMIYALHSHQFYNGNETLEVFEQALAAEEKRRAGQLIPDKIGCPHEALQYKQVGMYYEQVKRYLDVFGEENVHIVWFEDFVTDTEQAYSQVLGFLSLPAFKPSFARINSSRVIRSESFRGVMKQPNSLLRWLTKLLIPKMSWRAALKRQLWEWNSKEKPRPRMRSETKFELKSFFKKDITRLEELTKKDLRHWYD